MVADRRPTELGLYDGGSEPQTIAESHCCPLPQGKSYSSFSLLKMQLKRAHSVFRAQLSVRNSEPELKIKLCLPNIVFDYFLKSLIIYAAEKI